MTTLIKPQEVVNGGIFRPAPTNARFDINLIAPHILTAEERFLIPILGQALYDDMVAEQNAAVSNYNPDAGALVDKFIAPAPVAYETLWTKYLLRYLGYVVYYQSLPFIGVQVSSKGVFYNDSEFASNGGEKSIKFLQDTMLQNIDNLRELIKTYLCDNKGSYPLFDAKDCPCSSSDDCGCECHCGYYNQFGIPCKTCKTGKNTSTNILFY
jgi:hypothetical protein